MAPIGLSEIVCLLCSSRVLYSIRPISWSLIFKLCNINLSLYMTHLIFGFNTSTKLGDKDPQSLPSRRNLLFLYIVSITTLCLGIFPTLFNSFLPLCPAVFQLESANLSVTTALQINNILPQTRISRFMARTSDAFLLILASRMISHDQRFTIWFSRKSSTDSHN